MQRGRPRGPGQRPPLRAEILRHPNCHCNPELIYCPLHIAGTGVGSGVSDRIGIPQQIYIHLSLFSFPMREATVHAPTRAQDEDQPNHGAGLVRQMCYRPGGDISRVETVNRSATPIGKLLRRQHGL